MLMALLPAPSAFLLDDDSHITDTINPLYEPWIQTDQMVLSWLTSSLSPPVMHVVVKCISAAEAWKALQDRYAPSSHNRVIQLRGELLNLRRGDLSIADYLDKLNTLADQLALSGSPIVDADLIATIMNNVGPLYENTVASIQARETPISYAALEALLLSAETRHLTFQLSGDPSVPVLTAMAANRGRRTTTPTGFARGGGRGAVPPRSGHQARPYTAAAPNPGRINGGILGAAPSSSDRPPLRCQICRRNGHSAIDCYNRMNTSYEGCVPSARLTALAAQSNRVPSSASPAPTTWLLDSGANTHITNDPGQLTNAQEYTGIDQVSGIHGGQGLHISQIGTSFINSPSRSFPLSNTLYCPNASHNILSINQFSSDNDCFFVLHPNFFCVQDIHSGRILLSGRSNTGVYPYASFHSNKRHGFFSCMGVKVDDHIWHSRLGHPSSFILKHLVSTSKVPLTRHHFNSVCHSCPMGKKQEIAIFVGFFQPMISCPKSIGN